MASVLLNSSGLLFFCIFAACCDIGELVLEQCTPSSESQGTDCGCQGLKRDGAVVDMSDENNLNLHEGANVYSEKANETPHAPEHDIRSKVSQNHGS